MPLKNGHSDATIRTNIAKEVRSGRSRAQAVAIALSVARAAWRKRHKVGAFPARLAKKK